MGISVLSLVILPIVGYISSKLGGGWRGFVSGLVLLYVLVFVYKLYVFLASVPCPSHLPPDVVVSGCPSVFDPSVFGAALVSAFRAWAVLLLFYVTGFALYIYIPSEYNLNVRRYVAIFAALSFAVLWLVVFPWSLDVLFGY